MASHRAEVSPLALTFDERLYSIEAIQKAAYRYMNSFTSELSLSNGQINCLIIPGKELDKNTLEHHVEDFKKEILDQHLRLKIKAETEPVRNLILGIAFSNTGLQSDE